jgi:hypothetical protein
MQEKKKFIRGEYDYAVAVSSYKNISGRSGRYEWYRAWDYINQQMKSGKTSGIVYGFFDAQGYFIKDSHKNFIPDFYGYLFRCMDKDGDVYDKMKKIGVKYVLAGKNTGLCEKKEDIDKFYDCQTQVRFREYIESHGEEVFREGEVYVYILK